ncbi:hypothetical protein HBI88_150420 [Parastagonospora nodorum]|nr:hypothetical protein HBI97_011430 [Parastagonospora nodorum]KAH5810648.1 hypothetical protein HBI94_153060 [Parastagonospora nodorum]KAH5841748.1 hypothetical protein HBI93_011890 [Parastagonospora nodorum]KAH5843946.1 hypothetical protein HBI96_009370 [Parastagonospora nodorum]KAH5855586.1 hypothetical protein HBI91_161910 [Parastagonospora nodorum]
MDRFCTICSFQPKTYAGLAKHTSLEPSENIYEILQSNETYTSLSNDLSSTITVYDHIEKDKNADLAIADSISDALDMCAKDDLIRRKVLFQTHDRRLAEEPATAESQEAMLAMQSSIQDDIWIQEDIAKTLLDRATVVPIIILVDKTQLSLILGDVAAYTLLARFIPTTKIRDPLLKSQVYHYCIGKLLLQNTAKSRILLACADGRIRQCYLTICAILADYEEQVLLTGIKKNRYCTRCTLIAVVSLLFVSKAPFALHFIRAVCDLVTLAQYKSHDEDTLAYIQGALERMNVFKEEFRHALTHIIQDIRMYGALDSICTEANSKAHYITIVKQFYSMTNKKEYILQICLHNSRRTALLAADHATVLYLILIIIDYTRYDKDRKHIAYIGAFSEVLLFNNNRQIDNTTGMLSMRRRAWNAAPKRRTLQAFKFYDLSTIIRLVHLVPRDLPNSTTRTTISYYVNNYID